MLLGRPAETVVWICTELAKTFMPTSYSCWSILHNYHSCCFSGTSLIAGPKDGVAALAKAVGIYLFFFSLFFGGAESLKFFSSFFFS